MKNKNYKEKWEKLFDRLLVIVEKQEKRITDIENIITRRKNER